MNIVKIENNRRKTLWYLLCLCFTLLFAKSASLFLSFLKPPQPRNSFGGLIEACRLNEIPGVNTSPNHYAEGHFWIVHTDKGLVALHNNCTHLDCLFSWDEVKQTFLCPCHGSEFSFTGQVLKGPASENLRRFAVQLIADNGEVIRSTPENGRGIMKVNDLIENRSPQIGEDNQRANNRLIVQVDTSTKIEADDIANTMG